jgi:hypothetical protein
MNEQYEREFISRFIRPEKKARYEFALPRPKHRYAALMKLFSNDEIDFRFAKEYSGLASYLTLSMENKDTECYIISCDEETDGKVCLLEEAINIDTYNSLGIVIYCPKLRMAYYRGERRDEYILYKPS